MRYILIFLSSFSILIFSCASVFADVVYLKKGRQLKGIVVEDYVDRITLNTVDGEKVILKSEIKNILYDERVQNFIKLGDFHKDKGNLVRAYTYYRKAYQTDPDYEPAEARYFQVISTMLKQPYDQLEGRIERQRALLHATDKSLKIKEGVSIAAEKKLKNSFGVSLVPKDEKPYVNGVLPESSAYRAGIKRGDYIISVWNRLTGYMELGDVYDMILDTKTGEVKLAIERNVNIFKDASDPLGISLEITPKGLTVTRVLENSLAKKMGILESDVITKINEKSTRYMPLKKAVRLINSKDKKFSLVIQRDITLWLRRSLNG